MTSSINFLIGLAVAASAYALLVLYGRYAKAQLDRLRALDRWSSRFVALVEELAADPDAPVRLLQQLAMLNSIIGNPIAASVLCHALASANPTNVPDMGLSHATDSVKQRAVEAIITCFFAMSYSSLVNGIKARAMLAEHIQAMIKNPNATVSTARNMRFDPSYRRFRMHGPKAA